jgi:hypothetical protein
MLVMLNMTGLKRWYWWPVFHGEFHDRRLWYVGFKWLQLEATVYGPDMGLATVRMLNEYAERAKPDTH